MFARNEVGLVGEFLQLDLPQSDARAVGAAAVRRNRQLPCLCVPGRFHDLVGGGVGGAGRLDGDEGQAPCGRDCRTAFYRRSVSRGTTGSAGVGCGAVHCVDAPVCESLNFPFCLRFLWLWRVGYSFSYVSPAPFGRSSFNSRKGAPNPPEPTRCWYASDPSSLLSGIGSSGWCGVGLIAKSRRRPKAGGHSL